MGCVPSKGTISSPARGLDKLKREHGYIKGENAGRDANRGGEGVGRGGNVVQSIPVNKIAADELVGGWPRWLVENVQVDDLAGLVPKSADSYDKLAKIGQGTYSNVYKARDKTTGKIVALKKVRFDTSEPQSVKFMAREIIILKKLDHPNIIKLEGIATSRMQYSLYLVFDFMQSDLTKVISRPVGKLTEPQVKSYMQQLLSGLQHCHERGILHRDIKASNLLIDKNGVLKIADFGLANFYKNRPKRPLTSRVVTLWYRAPELLLGSTDYGVGIDLWSAGCLLAEMFVGRPIMPGRNEIEQLHKIFKLCGSPSEEYWKKVKPPATFRPPQQYKPNFKEAFPNFPNSAFALLDRLLSLDPAFRGTATSALQTEFFTTNPLPCDLSDLPIIVSEDDKPVQSMETRRMSILKQRSQKIHATHRRKVSFTDLIGDALSAKQEIRTTSNTQSQDMSIGNSSISSSSIAKANSGQELPPRSPTPAFRSQQNRSARTEAHPNALKNIKNYPLLLASLTEAAHHLEESNSSLYRRSISNIDFRNLDLEKISKLFGLEDNLAQR
ncbi:probable serine/threonine-protein kinase At1g54610 [Sesamum indicum]|uniref:Probable serine/threonine-protein kinase At1g54610 n=1 Tax=Sesamum indicum TaxID=4182 RepID=A0A6I9UP25_SESIN|nr:probable serine/threonine-protein kinase At1g54610 [Sesamum indicum]